MWLFNFIDYICIVFFCFFLYLVCNQMQYDISIFDSILLELEKEASGLGRA